MTMVRTNDAGLSVVSLTGVLLVQRADGIVLGIPTPDNVGILTAEPLVAALHALGAPSGLLLLLDHRALARRVEPLALKFVIEHLRFERMAILVGNPTSRFSASTLLSVPEWSNRVNSFEHDHTATQWLHHELLAPPLRLAQ